MHLKRLYPGVDRLNSYQSFSLVMDHLYSTMGIVPTNTYLHAVSLIKNYMYSTLLDKCLGCCKHLVSLTGAIYDYIAITILFICL